MIKESRFRFCLAAAAFAAAPFFADTAAAGPIFEPGTRVIVNATLRDHLVCCGETVSDRTVAEASVRTPDDPSANWYAPQDAISRGRASLPDASLKAEVLVPKHPSRNSFGTSEVAFNERVTLAVPVSGVAPGDALRLRFEIDGRIVSPGSPFNVAEFYILAGFSLRDPTFFDPSNPDAPVPYLLTYNKMITQGFRFDRREEMLFNREIGSGGTFDDIFVEGLAEARRFGFISDIPITDLIAAIGPERVLEFSASLYLSATVNSEAAAGAATTHLDFWDTAVIRATLPPGYAFLSESGFLSGSATTPQPAPDPVPIPTPVPEPASALLLLGGLAGLAAARRRR
ncbi:VPLPA-CTERM sorting domain-containing protein [Elioraea tepida]|uniref:VPLPA-CTERM sorting domain-containing protein n=1 Tax=Elioraea tepida TaxID=2843330 RepID=A0A975YL34_9PROT|nr:VPLPA-CTERM sorting domain-containing protein [Elioraea tepida]QXM26092.1 VPLPA-CTERM sorting domain-containing protein [Elioraea tepida]